MGQKIRERCTDNAVGNSRLEGWKEIAAYLKTTVRTAQRWECEQGLPVHRSLRRTRDAVYSFASEIDVWRSHSRGISREQPLSLAVLPFATTGAEAWIGYALADELIQTLSSVKALRTLARTSSFTLYEHGRTAPEICAALGADALLEGNLQREGTDFRVRTRLVTASGLVVWSQAIERDESCLFTLQREISQGVCSHLRLRLARDHVCKPVTRAVYEQFLQARCLFLQMERQDLLRAMDLARQCLGQDPDFAPAYAELGAMWEQLALSGAVKPREAYVEARRMLETALRLDSHLGGARFRWARHLSLCEFRWGEAEAEFEQALRLAPHDGLGRYFYGSDFLRLLGRYEESLCHLTEALRSDPLNPALRVGIALAYAAVGDLSPAIRAAEQAIELSGELWILQWLLGALLLRSGRVSEALAWLERAHLHAPAHSWVAPTWASALLLVGRTAEAHSLREQLLRERERHYVPATTLALLEAAAGNVEESLNWLDVAFEEKDPVLPYLPKGNVGVFIQPESEQPVRSTPRWRELVQRMGLTPLRKAP